MYNLVFLYYGLLTILTQLVIFRELVVLFYGSELFLGTFLSSWLVWVGLGSFFIWRLLKKERPVTDYFSYGFLAIALLFPTTILLIRASKGAFPFGEFIGPVGTILYTFNVMSVLCFVIGGEFSLACAAAANTTKKENVLGRVYMYESLGAVIGGALFTYVLIGSVPTFIIALLLSFGCILVSFALLPKKRPTKSTLLVIAAIAILFINFRIEPAINRIEWNRYEFIKQKEARNVTLALANMGSIKNVFMDGMLSTSFPNPEGYEPIAHWPLLATAEPNQILIIGDTSLGALKEVLKYNPKKIDYVMLDSSFIDFAEPYLDTEDISALRNPAVHIHYVDPRAFIKDSKDKYDTVIINIRDVPNLRANRFYTKEFYGLIRSILKPNGILALSIASSENYLSERTRLFNASVYHTLRSVFNTIEVIPGDTITFLSSPSAIDLGETTILERFNTKKISNHYVIPSYIKYKLDAARRTELKKLLTETTGAKINKDFKPTTCYYFTSLWLNKFASPLGSLVVSILVVAAALGIFKKRSLLPLAQRKESILIFVLGFVGISLELILLLSYQIISGYVYWQMGILFASFMSGLFLGSLLGNYFKHGSRRIYFLSLIALSLIIAGIAVYAAHLLPHFIHLSTIQNMFIFISLLAIIGTIIGASFVIAGFLVSENEIMVKAGSLYAADLWGASFGAILSTNLIVLIFGISGALNFSAVIALVGLAIFLILSRKTANG